MAASYSAVRRNASCASRKRVASLSDPPLARSSSSTAPYCDCAVTTATLPWFLAAARIIVGPPTSICSIASACVDAGPCHRLLEGIERDDDQVDRA